MEVGLSVIHNDPEGIQAIKHVVTMDSVEPRSSVSLRH